MTDSPQTMWNSIAERYSNWQNAIRENGEEAPTTFDHYRVYWTELNESWPYITQAWEEYLSARDAARHGVRTTNTKLPEVKIEPAPAPTVFTTEPSMDEDATPRTAAMILNTRTGELTIRARTTGSDGPTYTLGTGPSYTPNSETATVPEVLGWPCGRHPNWTKLLAASTRAAQSLLDNLITVPGTDQRDWTPDSGRAADDLSERASGDKSRYRTLYYVDVRDHITPLHLDLRLMTDPARDPRHMAEWVHHMIITGGQAEGPPDPERALSGPDQSEYPDIQITGIVAWIYGLRRALAGNRTAVPAPEWFTDHPPTHVRAETTDAALERIIAAEEDEASTQGTYLVGAANYLTARRNQARRDLTADLEEAGASVKTLEAELKAARARRTAALTQILSYTTETDAELGRRARMSRQAIAQARERLDSSDETQEETK